LTHSKTQIELHQKFGFGDNYKMQIVTTFRQVPTSKPLRDYAELKISKLEKYHQGIIEAKITFSSGKTSHNAEVTLIASGTTIRASESSSDAYSALDLVVDKLSRQLCKFQDKLKTHKAAKNAVSADELLEAVSKKKEKIKKRTGKPRIIDYLTFQMKPLFPDDAMLQLDQAGDDFLVFINAESYDVNVIFRRPDGHYGLIVPDR